MHDLSKGLDTCNGDFEIILTGWKVSKYGVISGPYFPAFGLNTEIYGVNLRIQSEYRKDGPEITPYLDTFQAVPLLGDFNSDFSFLIQVVTFLNTFYKNESQKSFVTVIGRFVKTRAFVLDLEK